MLVLGARDRDCFDDIAPLRSVAGGRVFGMVSKTICVAADSLTFLMEHDDGKQIQEIVDGHWYQ